MNTDELKSRGGWLSFFLWMQVITLFGSIPDLLRTGSEVLTNWSNIDEQFYSSVLITLILAVFTTILNLITIASIFAENRIGLLILKLSIWISNVLDIVFSFYLLIFEKAFIDKLGLSYTIIPSIIVSIIYLSVWIPYFNRSIRVANIYGVNYTKANLENDDLYTAKPIKGWFGENINFNTTTDRTLICKAESSLANHAAIVLTIDLSTCFVYENVAIINDCFNYQEYFESLGNVSINGKFLTDTEAIVDIIITGIDKTSGQGFEKKYSNSVLYKYSVENIHEKEMNLADKA